MAIPSHVHLPWPIPLDKDIRQNFTFIASVLKKIALLLTYWSLNNMLSTFLVFQLQTFWILHVSMQHCNFWIIYVVHSRGPIVFHSMTIPVCLLILLWIGLKVCSWKGQSPPCLLESMYECLECMSFCPAMSVILWRIYKSTSLLSAILAGTRSISLDLCISWLQNKIPDTQED